MSICFVGPGGVCEYPWIRYALLRDNVLHHLEQGDPSPAFSAIYGIANALRGHGVRLSAVKLRDELVQAEPLRSLPLEQLAISAGTLAAISMEHHFPITSPTRIIGTRLYLPWLSKSMPSLDAVFGSLWRELLAITEGAIQSDEVEVYEA